MHYFSVKKTVLAPPQDTTLGIVTSGEPSYLYAEANGLQYWGVDTQDVDFLSKQHSECEVAELDFATISPILKSCALCESINQITQAKIRTQYSADDELKLNRLANNVAKTQTPQEFIDYNTFVEECRAYGSQLKINAGLKQ